MISLKFDWQNPVPINQSASSVPVSLNLASIVVVRAKVTSVNGLDGDVQLDAQSVNADPAGSAAAAKAYTDERIDSLPSGFEIIDFNPDDYLVGTAVVFNAEPYALFDGSVLTTNPDNKQYLYPGIGLNPDQGYGFASAKSSVTPNMGTLTYTAMQDFAIDQYKVFSALPTGTDNANFVLSTLGGVPIESDYLFVALAKGDLGTGNFVYNAFVAYPNDSEPVQSNFELDSDMLVVSVVAGVISIHGVQNGVSTLLVSKSVGILNEFNIARLGLSGTLPKLSVVGDMEIVTTLSSGSVVIPSDLEDGTYLRVTKDVNLLGYDLLTGDVLQVYDNHTRGLVIRQDNYFDYLKLLFDDSELIEAIQDRVAIVEGALGDKVTTVQLNAIVADLATKSELDSKASYTDVANAVDQKADRSELYDKVGTTTFNGFQSQTNATLVQLQNNKANLSVVDSLSSTVSTLSSSQSLKADLVNGLIPANQLPAYVDDVLEYSSWTGFPGTGESGKLYIDTTTNKTYRWAGSGYTPVSDSISLGETSSTSYRGDRGKIAYDHSQSSGNPHNTQIADIPNLQYQLSRRVDSSDATYQAIQNYYVNNGVEFAGLGYPNFINGGNTDITQKGTAYSLKFDSGFGYVAFAANAPNIGSWWYMRNGQSNSVRRYGFELFAYDEVAGINTYNRALISKVTTLAGDSSVGRIYKSDDPVIYNTSLDTLENLVTVDVTGELKRITAPSQQWATRLPVWGGNSAATGTVSAIDSVANALWKLQNSKEPNIAAGTTSQYLRGDKAWRDFATDVRATLLTGLSTATATVIVATDSVLSALGKLQAQVTANSTAIAAKVDVVQLTKAQYDALTTAEKNSTTKLYVIVG